nr:unnamed protein product [Naegleria fowleri]
MPPHKQKKQIGGVMDEDDEEIVEALPHSDERDEKRMKERKSRRTFGDSKSKRKYGSETHTKSILGEKKAKKTKQSNSTSYEQIKISSSSIMEDEEEKSSNPSSSGVASSSDINTSPQSITHLNHPTQPQQQQASTVLLSFNNYDEWTTEEAASLLRMKKREGGASLSVVKVKPLYSAGFDGTSLDNIVKDIKRHDVDFAIASLSQSKDYTQVPSSTCKTVVNWVNDTLIPKLFRLWDKDQVKSKLCRPKSKGGAALDGEKVQTLYEEEFDGSSLLDISNSVEEAKRLGNQWSATEIVKTVLQKEIDLSTCETVVNWVVHELIKKDKIQVTLYNFVSDEIEYKLDNYEYEEIDGDKIDRKYIRKLALHQEELLFLSDLSKYNLKDLTAPFPKTSDPLRFNLKHREDTIKQILQVGAKHHEIYSLTKKSKQQLCFFIAKGGSGSGKTRILTEIPNILRNGELDNIFKNTNIIYFNFANGCSLAQTDRDKKSVSMIVSRIVYAAFENISEFAQNTPPSENDLFLYEVMRIISKKLHEKYGETVIPLVLAFDEYQLATRPNPGLHTSIQHKLGWYMRFIQNRHQILLFPAFGGTLTESDAKMEPTQYTPVHLSLPSLRPMDIAEIMADMGLSKLYEGRYKEFWDMIGIIPRHLDWALGNDVEKLKRLEFNDETVRSTIYSNVTTTVIRQYSVNSADEYFGELALNTISGLKRKKDEKLITYISEGRVYIDDNGFIGVPLVVIDILANKLNYIPKHVVSDFITVSNKPLWEKFEELCLKTMTARLNVLYTLNHSKEVQFSELFRGAYFKSDLGFISLKSFNAMWFYYDCLNEKISSRDENENEKLINTTCVKKAKKNQNDIDGILCPLVNANTNKRMIFVTQNKFQYEDSQKRTLEPSNLVSYYEKAIKTAFKDSDTFVIIFTNKKVSKNTREMVIKGEITTTKKAKKGVSNSKEQKTVDTGNLILVSGDCFSNFFHPFISNFLH